MNKKLLISVFFIFFFSCKQHTNNQVEVYNNDFESGDLTNIKGGVLGQFNGSKVLGPFSAGDFVVSLKNLPPHDLVTISFDLYIHDNWRGNLLPDGPAIWQLLINGDLFINTTFSNLDCPVGYNCPPQAYPANYPNNYNNPKTGAYRTNLPGACKFKTSPKGSTLYKITKTFKHTGGTISFECLDKLDQKDFPDPLCEKSWSVDNIIVKAISL